MAIQPVFVNTFQKGSDENANLGVGSFVGIETYSTKGVAKLTRDTTQVDGGIITSLPISSASNDTYVWVQEINGNISLSTNSGDTWVDVSNPNSTGSGQGIVFFDGILYEFRGGEIWYQKSPYGSGNWSGSAWQTGLSTDFATPFIFPSDYGFYFGNGNNIGLAQESTGGVPIDPATPSTYNYSATILTLPPLYTVTSLSFLPPSQLMIGTGSAYNPQVADIISWDTISKNKFGPPLRLYSPAGEGANGVNQLINRNNVLYAVTGGNMCLYETDGTHFQLLEDFSLRTSWRQPNGAQASFPVFLNPQNSAVAILGNKILFGVSTSISTGTGSPYGLFPMGIWTYAFAEQDTSTQLEFTISTGTIRTNGFQTFSIGVIIPVSQNQAIIGWQDNNSYGLDKIDLDNFQTDGNTVVIQSQMYEIGSPLNRPAVNKVEINLVNTLQTGQTIAVYGRSTFDQDFTLWDTFTGDGTQNYYFTTVPNPLGANTFFQLQLKMATTMTLQKFTPQIRNVIIT